MNSQTSKQISPIRSIDILIPQKQVAAFCYVPNQIQTDFQMQSDSKNTMQNWSEQNPLTAAEPQIFQAIQTQSLEQQQKQNAQQNQKETQNQFQQPEERKMMKDNYKKQSGQNKVQCFPSISHISQPQDQIQKSLLKIQNTPIDKISQSYKPYKSYNRQNINNFYVKANKSTKSLIPDQKNQQEYQNFNTNMPQQEQKQITEFKPSNVISITEFKSQQDQKQIAEFRPSDLRNVTEFKPQQEQKQITEFRPSNMRNVTEFKPQQEPSKIIELNSQRYQKLIAQVQIKDQMQDIDSRNVQEYRYFAEDKPSYQNQLTEFRPNKEKETFLILQLKQE